MSITASLDKRQAVALGETSLPAPKVYGRKSGQFSDITRLLASGSPALSQGAAGRAGDGGGSGAGAPAGSKDGQGDSGAGSGIPGTNAADNSMGEAQRAGQGEGGVPESLGVSAAQLAREAADDLQASLVLNTQRRKPGGRAALRQGESELAKFARSFEKKDRVVHKHRVEKRIVQITRRIRGKCDRERDRLDAVGLFHPDANKMRVDTLFSNQLKRLLNLDRIEAACLRDMLAESKGETQTHSKNATAMEDKFAAAAAAAGPLPGSGEVDTTQKVKGTRSSGASSVASSSAAVGMKSKASVASASSGSSASLASRSLVASSGKLETSLQDGRSSIANKNKNKAGFRPGDRLSNDQSERIAGHTQKQLKQKVRTKFASGEADIDAEKFPSQDASMELDSEGGSLWDDGGDDHDVQEETGEEKIVLGRGSAPTDVVADGGSAILDSKASHARSGGSRSGERSVRFGGAKGSTAKSITGAASSAIGGELEPGSVLEDGSVVVDPNDLEQRYSEYEIRYDEWGQEVKVRLPPRVRPMANTKKDNRVDSFEIFRKKKVAEARAKKMKRHRLLRKGDLDNTIDDQDFVDDLGYRTSTIAQALGHGKHTPARMARAPTRPVGSTAVSKPLPGYIRNEVKMARRAAGIGGEDAASPPETGGDDGTDELSERPSSVPSWAVDSLPSTAGSLAMSESELGLDGNMVENRPDPEICGGGSGLVPENAIGDEPNKNKKKRRQKRGNSRLRQRVENLWEDLEMPFSVKMDFAARYSEPRRAESMNDALPLWEHAAALVRCRERLITLVTLVTTQVSFVVCGSYGWFGHKALPNPPAPPPPPTRLAMPARTVSLFPCRSPVCLPYLRTDFSAASCCACRRVVRRRSAALQDPWRVHKFC